MEHGFLYEVGIFLMFFTGQVVHAWLRAQASIHSKLSGINTYRDYAKFHAPSLAYRFFAALCVLFGYSTAVSIWPSIANLTGGHPLSISPSIAGLYGLAADTLLDGAANILSRKYPSLGLQRELPPQAEIPKD